MATIDDLIREIEHGKSIQMTLAKRTDEDITRLEWLKARFLEIGQLLDTAQEKAREIKATK
jgi:hypothetical protein